MNVSWKAYTTIESAFEQLKNQAEFKEAVKTRSRLDAIGSFIDWQITSINV